MLRCAPQTLLDRYTQEHCALSLATASSANWHTPLLIYFFIYNISFSTFYYLFLNLDHIIFLSSFFKNHVQITSQSSSTFNSIAYNVFPFHLNSFANLLVTTVLVSCLGSHLHVIVQRLLHDWPVKTYIESYSQSCSPDDS